MEDLWTKLMGPVKSALRMLDARDRELLAWRANERSITHKLAEHLSPHIDELFKQPPGQPPHLAVDCEYNRFGEHGDPKQLPWTREEAIQEESAASENAHHQPAGAYYTPNPDIAVHHRGDQSFNALVIELKAYFNRTPAAVLIDKMKLVGYLHSPTHYQLGLFLDLDLTDRIVLNEAKLVRREKEVGKNENERWELWNKGKALLLKPNPETMRPGFISPKKETHDAASELIPRFEQAFEFLDVRNDIRWD